MEIADPNEVAPDPNGSFPRILKKYSYSFDFNAFLSMVAYLSVS